MPITQVTSHGTLGGRYHYGHFTGEERDLIVEVGAQMRSQPGRLAIARFLVLSSFF